MGEKGAGRANARGRARREDIRVLVWSRPLCAASEGSRKLYEEEGEGR